LIESAGARHIITVPLGGALGPALMGVGFDRSGSYQLGLSLCLVAVLVAAVLVLRLRLSPTFKE
jgi:cyanate permease